MVTGFEGVEKVYHSPEMEILAIRNNLAVRGANDSEFEAINNILERLRKNEITPEESVREARKIAEDK